MANAAVKGPSDAYLQRKAAWQEARMARLEAREKRLQERERRLAMLQEMKPAPRAG